MMSYMTQGWILVYLFMIIWLWGWIAMARDVEFEHSDRLGPKIGSWAVLFFIWPYIAFCAMRQGDI